MAFHPCILLQVALVRATVADLTGRRPLLGECLRDAFRFVLPVLGMTILMTLGAMLGFLLLIVPGIILWLMWSVSVPALVEERRGVIASMRRSAELTRGYKWPIFGLLVIVAIAGSMLGGVLGILNLLAGGPQSPLWLLRVVVAGLAQTVSSMISATTVAVIYVDLREAKEGTMPSTLAAIFA